MRQNACSGGLVSLLTMIHHFISDELFFLLTMIHHISSDGLSSVFDINTSFLQMGFCFLPLLRLTFDTKV